MSQRASIEMDTEASKRAFPASFSDERSSSPDERSSFLDEEFSY